MQKLLVIDDEPSILKSFQRAFARDTVEVLTAKNADLGEQVFVEQKPDVVVLDLSLPGASGLECFQRLRAIDSRVPVIFITGHGTVESAIEATKFGAYEYVFKPVELEEMSELLERAFNLSRLIRVQPEITHDRDVDPETNGHAIVGRCRAMKEVYQSIGRVAAERHGAALGRKWDGKGGGGPGDLSS